MIWVHCGDKTEVTSTLSLAARLNNLSDARGILVTADDTVVSLLQPAPEGVHIIAAPPENSAKSKAFLEYWTPDYLIWNGGALRPVLLRCLDKSGIGATLINARNSTLFAGSSRWLPRAARSAVQPFSRVMTADGATATRLIRGGVPREMVVATGPILEEPLALGHDANELTVLVETLGTRSVWFAANVTAAEVADMAAAQLAACRKNHRLLLVITPRDHTSGSRVAQILREAGLKVGLRSDGETPEPEMQVYVADLEDELGLWYRISPLTFMGGTLGKGGAESPFEPIALGSAVVNGPHKAPFESRYARMAEAQASRQIRSAAELGIAIGTLISPEQTARMAMAGWLELTRNAEIVNQLISLAIEDGDVAN